MKGIYRIAGENIEIVSLYQMVQSMCKDYACEGTPALIVETTPADLQAEAGEEHKEFNAPYMETLAVYRKIAEAMPAFGTVLFHGSVVAVDGLAYLFTAKSGTGKSTHTRLWRELLGDRAVMVNDDKPLIHISEKEAIVYGTPWDGKHRLSKNTAVPVRAICILQRGKENRIEQIAKEDALPMLVQQTYRPRNPAALEKTLSLIDKLDVLFYRLHCNMDISAAELAWEAMKPKQANEEQGEQL